MLVLVIILVLVVGVVFPRVGELRFDYLGVLVTIFSAMITLLIGWQIFSFISRKKEFDDKVLNIDNRVDELDERFTKLNADIDVENRRLISAISDTNYLNKTEFYLMFTSQYIHLNQYDNAVKMLFRGLSICLCVKTRDEHYKSKIDSIKMLMNVLSENIPLSSDTIAWVKVIAENSNDPDIVDYVKKLEANQVKSED